MMKVGSKVRFKSHNPDMVLKVTAVYEKLGVIMLEAVEGGSWVGGTRLTAIEKVEPKLKRKRARRKKIEDYWL